MTQPDPRALVAQLRSVIAAARRFPGLDVRTLADLAAAFAAALDRAEMAEAKAAVIGGEACLAGRAQGRGPCGACAVCCKELRDRIALLEAAQATHRAEIERLRGLLAEYGRHAKGCGAGIDDGLRCRCGWREVTT